jgi:hypothetical protein
MRLMRSTTCRFSLLPRKRVLSVKLVVSMTRVSPSHRPMESPIHFLTGEGRCWPPSLTTRTSWFISLMIMTMFRVCTIW